MPTSGSRAGRWLHQFPGRLPLAIKLPLLMSGILAVVLAIAAFATYSTLRATALDRAHERVRRATTQLGVVAGAGVGTQQARYARVAGDALVQRALRGDSVDVAPVLSRLSLPNDSGMPVELWTTDGRRVAFVGNDLRSQPIVSPGRPELPEQIARVLAPAEGGRGDSIHYTPLYGENGRVHFWIVMPVRGGGQTLGYIAHQRRIAQNATTVRTLRELAGDSVTLYYRNLDGSFWASASGLPISPHASTDTLHGIARTTDGVRLVVDEVRVGATPIVIGMSIPESSIVSRALTPVRRLIALSVVLLLVGGLAAWAIGHRIARPLHDITGAAERMATGDFAARVPEQGDPEIQRLARTFNHMAAEIGESRRALEQQTREARAANNAKSEFLTTMSHELRTPLNAIGGYVELLDMELRGPLTPAQKRDLERIKASQEHLLGLISGVLDLARVEAGKVAYDIEDIALEPFLSSLDALIAPQAAAKQIALECAPCGPDLAVRADREKLRQILLNLLSNAIRHTPAGGHVTLSAAAGTHGSTVEIVVQDTGPGIPGERRDEIFEPFVQLDRSLAHPREGLGLGLAISRDLARGMSGDLTVDAGATSGARFVLTLVRGRPDAARNMMMSGEVPVVH